MRSLDANPVLLCPVWAVTSGTWFQGGLPRSEHCLWLEEDQPEPFLRSFVLKTVIVTGFQGHWGPVPHGFPSPSCRVKQSPKPLRKQGRRLSRGPYEDWVLAGQRVNSYGVGVGVHSLQTKSNRGEAR